MKIENHPVVTKETHRAAFTLIEMIGVLAVIAILAAVLIPRVFSAIDSARINNAVMSAETCKTAAADHYGKYGKLDAEFGTNSGVLQFPSGIAYGYDTNILMPEGLLDKPFSVKIGGGDPSTNSVLELAQGGKDNGGSGYSLDGITIGTTNSQYVLEAVIYGVSAADAKDLNDRLDGVSLGAASLTAADTKGRVEYAAPVNNTTTVYVYLTSR